MSPVLLQVLVKVPSLYAGLEAISSAIVFGKNFEITAEEEGLERAIVVAKAVVLVAGFEGGSGI